MKFHVKNLKAYFIILISIGYAAFTSSTFIASLIKHDTIAIIAATILAVIAHLYLLEGVRELKTDKFHTNCLIAILLCGSVVYFDLNGVWQKSDDHQVTPVLVEQQKEKDKLENAISSLDTLLVNNAQHTKNGKTNWAMYNTYNKTYKQREGLKEEWEQLQKRHKAELSAAVDQKETQAVNMIGLSVILFVLSTLVSFTLKDPEENLEARLSSIGPEEREVSKEKLDVLVGKVKTKSPDFPFESIDNKSEEERIKLASLYIKATNETDSRKLCGKFKLNFIMLKKARRLVLKAVEIDKKSKEAQLGFSFD